jgi:hypothetical protein
MRFVVRLLQHVVAKRLEPLILEPSRQENISAEDGRRWEHGGQRKGVTRHGVARWVNEVKPGLTALHKGQRGVVAVDVADCGHVTWKRVVDCRGGRVRRGNWRASAECWLVGVA